MPSWKLVPAEDIYARQYGQLHIANVFHGLIMKYGPVKVNRLCQCIHYTIAVRTYCGSPAAPESEQGVSAKCISFIDHRKK